jgi:hypothetical protein
MSNNTLTYLTNSWPIFLKVERTGYGKSLTNIKIGNPKVSTSKSGSGMLILNGIQVLIGDKWIDAHLSFPPDNSGTGTFTEGHLKIESGPLLNQYFFSCDDNETWEVEKLTNSATVKTKTDNPGKWSNLPAVLWHDIDTLVTHLAYLR